MTTQTVGAIVITAVAAAWLVRRFWKRGLDDDDAHGCSSCHVDAAAPKVTGLSRGPAPRERPDQVESDSDAPKGSRTRRP